MQYYRDLSCKLVIKFLKFLWPDKFVGDNIRQEIKMSKRINMNDMANAVAMNEKGRTEVNIAQIKEVMRIFLEELSCYEDEEILEVVKRYRK